MAQFQSVFDFFKLQQYKEIFSKTQEGNDEISISYEYPV